MLMAIIYDPTKVDPQSAIDFRTCQHARRQLHKDQQRVQQFTKSILHARRPYNDIVGPAHGFLKATGNIGIDVDPMNPTIGLMSPNGATTGVMHPDKTRYTIVVNNGSPEP